MPVLLLVLPEGFEHAGVVYGEHFSLGNSGRRPARDFAFPLGTHGFDRVLKAQRGVTCENAHRLSHHLDLYHPLRNRHLPDPCIPRRVHAESLSCFNRACGCSFDLGDHAGTALDSSVIQGRFRAALSKL